jgi:hypothetical protein
MSGGVEGDFGVAAQLTRTMSKRNTVNTYMNKVSYGYFVKLSLNNQAIKAL